MQRPVTSQTRNEQLLMEKAQRQMAVTDDPIEKIRCLCLQRGTNGILALGKQFRIMDDNRSGDLSFQEFKNGLEDMGFQGDEEELKKIFQMFDLDNSGTVKYDEFLKAVRPKMSPMRISLIEKAFEKMDKTGDGAVTMEDLQGVYNFKQHPEYLNGNKTEKELLEDFIKKFEKAGSIDGKLTKDEFIDYYSGVSASIDEDIYFDLMMRKAWKL